MKPRPATGAVDLVEANRHRFLPMPKIMTWNCLGFDAGGPKDAALSAYMQANGIDTGGFPPNTVMLGDFNLKEDIVRDIYGAVGAVEGYRSDKWSHVVARPGVVHNVTTPGQDGLWYSDHMPIVFEI